MSVTQYTTACKLKTTSRKEQLLKRGIKMKQNDSKKTVERQTGGKRSKKRELFQKLQAPSKDLPNPRC